ncbi:hypothetical protein [Streptomyces himalayensis]|uniref:Uncharacterized protein n=1 Tax=Streptomyces himalayensis subsp. himalayensis TaxID=2756131 RepID=A0A7W0DKL6_9ACTN|nr:hypothetical protein [Streptomyces himalayensis]MBA2946823.1 hypothetical protein [Streptomyces himalayensis subsp. himalayensis]
MAEHPFGQVQRGGGDGRGLNRLVERGALARLVERGALAGGDALVVLDLVAPA